MKRAELGDVAEVDGRLARVISINEGYREIGFEFVGSQPCTHCGRPDRFHVNEGTPLWESAVRPVSTCGRPTQGERPAWKDELARQRIEDGAITG